MIKKLKNYSKGNGNFKGFKLICFYVLIFVVGCIVGWIYEELFYLLDDHILCNRGFLYGPYLPVYGIGAIVLTPILRKLKKNPLLVFLSAMIITGIVEYVIGQLMWNVYHEMWWDYTGLFLNIGGFVCLRSVLTFAIGGLMLVYIVDPLVVHFVSKISAKKCKLLVLSIGVIFIIDLVFTLLFRHPL